MVRSLFNALLCLAFILFAYVNLNDSDGFLWVGIYLLAALVCGLGAFRKYYPWATLTLVALYVGYALVLYFSQDGVHDWLFTYNSPSISESMQATKPYIEKTREFFGLLIASGALLFNFFSADKRNLPGIQ
ncbi:MAG TPA: transmembrane 220 family protein [Flavisolibacter sp.]|jgi:hypothetical protein|nr:transmembrane 220 family protein [Flavisolibacter sp.]